ncbi:MAG: methionine--tRNA ligase [Candidatus Delongbacteria bacterium]|jgi:methionyl-tRNA synthetase|nr:methionine--tRNA ligase [Candidatus Delongbacteria bacterium]
MQFFNNENEDEMKKKFLTTPIYYVNGKPHLGHAYTTILCDAFKRYYKLYGYDAVMITGVDEHGQKVYEAAVEKNMTPQAYCDSLIPAFEDLFKKCDVEHDIFFRTTSGSHEKKVQAILQNLYDKGDIYKDDYEGNYCTPCETFFTEKDLVEGNCPECGRPTTLIKEQNYFFDMAKYAGQYEKFLLEHDDFIYPKFRKNEVLGILKQGLRPLCISRKKEKMPWGIEIPFDKDFVTYVWFDALTNYINGIGYMEDEKKFNEYWPTTTHLMAKDILLHHTIYWPTMLLAMGLSLPKNILIHGWWMGEGGKKMSKSLGNVIDPNEIIDKYGSSSFRFFVLRDMSLGHDGVFSIDSFLKRHNVELANDFGNLLNRASHMIVRNFDGKIPAPSKKTEFCDPFINEFKTLLSGIEQLIYDFDLNRALDDIMKMIRNTNKYMEDCAPWQLLKTDKELCGSVLYNALEAVRLTSLLLSPVIPKKFEELKDIFKGEIEPELEFGKLTVGREINKAVSLFPKIEVEAKEQKKPESKAPTAETGIDIADFAKVEIKTGKILSCENVEGSDKLLKLQIDLGSSDVRQIISGIAKFYKPEDTVGKHVLVASNLKPAMLMGTESQGMLLSVKAGKELKIVEIDKELPLGKKLN